LVSRYDLTEFEWRVIAPLLPNKPRGVARVDDRRVLNGIFWVLRSGSPWRDLPERYGPYTTCYNRFRRWTKAGVWDRIMDAITDAYGGDVRMIDGTSVRVHHAAATLKKATRIDVLDEAGAVCIHPPSAALSARLRPALKSARLSAHRSGRWARSRCFQGLSADGAGATSSGCRS
jgi:transposase